MSTAWEPPGYIAPSALTFSNGNQTANCSSGFGAMCISDTTFTPSATPFVVQFQVPLYGGQFCIGMVGTGYSGPNIREYYNSGSASDCFWYAENGAVFVDAGYTGTSLEAVAAGYIIRLYVVTAGFAFQVDDGSGGPYLWNGSYTLAQIQAGTGLFSWSSVSSTSFNAFVSFYSSGTTVSILDDPLLVITSVSAPIGYPTQITWESLLGISVNIAWSFDGSTFTTAGGPASSGTTTNTTAVFEDFTLHNCVITEAGDVIGSSDAFFFTPTNGIMVYVSATHQAAGTWEVSGSIPPLDPVFFITHTVIIPTAPSFAAYGIQNLLIGPVGIITGDTPKFEAIIGQDGGSGSTIEEVFLNILTTPGYFTVADGQQYTLAGKVDMSVPGYFTFTGTYTGYGASPVDVSETVAIGFTLADLTTWVLNNGATYAECISSFTISSYPPIFPQSNVQAIICSPV